MVLLILILIAQAISLLCIILHYSQHFQCRKRTNDSNSALTSPTTSLNRSPRRKRNTSIFFADLRHHVNSTAFVRTFQNPKRCCKSCFRSIDGEEFDLFPISFLVYLIFTFILLTLVTINEFYLSANYNLNYTQNPLYLLITRNYNKSIRQTTIVTATTKNDKYTHSSIAFDYIICYWLLIVFVFESLFHYHRYYITQYASQHFFNPTWTSEAKYFIVYAFVFSILFLLQIHVYYWLFPLVIGLHCIFNIYCTYTFCGILIERYKFYKNAENGLQKIHEELLQTVYTIRKASIISIMFSSVCIAVFCIVYNMHIISYIGVLFNISNITFMFNFVRIRSWIHSNLLFICIHNKNKNKIKTINNPKQNMIPEHEIQRDNNNITIAIHIGEHINNNTNDIIPKFTPTTSGKSSIKLTPSKLTPSTCTVDVTPITEDDISPVTDNDIVLSPINTDYNSKITCTNSSHSIVNKGATTSSKCLLNVPTPISINKTTINNSKQFDDDNDEYQKWYLNQHTTSSEPNTPNNMKKKNSLVIPSLRISISNSMTNKSKRKFKLYNHDVDNIINIDKTPLNDIENIDINTYDMTPIHTINDNDNNSDEEPSVEDINTGNKTPINDMFMGIIKRASSLVKSYSNDANKSLPKLQQRGRSYSDPIQYKINTNANAPQNNNESIYDKEDNNNTIEYSIMSHSANFIGIQRNYIEFEEQKQKSNKIVPQLVDHYSEPKPHTFGNTGSNIVKFTPNNNNMLFQNEDEVLISVLVSHGFCSRSSLKLFK